MTFQLLYFEFLWGLFLGIPVESTFSYSYERIGKWALIPAVIIGFAFISLEDSLGLLPPVEPGNGMLAIGRFVFFIIGIYAGMKATRIIFYFRGH